MSTFAPDRETAPTYTGIGSRQTPPEILKLMQEIAHFLARAAGYTLRSGGAEGADQAFGRGAGSRAYIYLPWPGFGHVEEGALGLSLGSTIDPDLERMTRALHPAWPRLTQGVQKLHARNVRQVLGIRLNQPSDFVVCWTEDGREIGGTATALKLARARNIPIYNLGVPHVLERFQTLPVDDVIAIPRRDVNGNVRPYVHLGAELPF